MAIFLALLGAFFFGILSVLTRRALRVAPDPVTGAFVTNVVALGAAAAVAAIAGDSILIRHIRSAIGRWSTIATRSWQAWSAWHGPDPAADISGPPHRRVALPSRSRPYQAFFAG